MTTMPQLFLSSSVHMPQIMSTLLEALRLYLSLCSTFRVVFQPIVLFLLV